MISDKKHLNLTVVNGVAAIDINGKRVSVDALRGYEFESVTLTETRTETKTVKAPTRGIHFIS